MTDTSTITVTIVAASGTCPLCSHRAIPLWRHGRRIGCASCLSHRTPVGGGMTFKTNKRRRAARTRATA